jgi:hypothetical protein
MATTRSSGYVVTHSVWNAVLSALTDDGQTFSGNFTGVITAAISATAFGNHTISAGGTGGNELRVRNTTAGTGNYGGLVIGNDGSATAAYLYQTSTTYTPSGRIVADGLHLETGRTGGISIAANNASGDLRFYAGAASSPSMTIDQDGYTTIEKLVLKAYDSSTVASLSNGDNNNLDPGSRLVAQYNVSTSNCDITGFSGGAEGRILLVCSAASLGGALRLASESASSTAANRITAMAGGTLTLGDGQVAMLIYNSSATRWRAYTLF